MLEYTPDTLRDALPHLQHARADVEHSGNADALSVIMDLEGALSRLPFAVRRAVEARLVRRLPVAEACAVTNLSERTLYRQVDRGLEFMAQGLAA